MSERLEDLKRRQQRAVDGHNLAEIVEVGELIKAEKQRLEAVEPVEPDDETSDVVRVTRGGKTVGWMRTRDKLSIGDLTKEKQKKKREEEK